MSMDISDFYQTFFDEADELLADMEQHLLDLVPSAPDTEQLNAIFRAAHSIKGGAGTFGFSVLQETTHLLFAGKPVSLLRRAFGEENEENTFVLPGTMSRKKQVVPLLIEAARQEELQ